VEYFNVSGERISYQEWYESEIAAWRARENDPAVIDSIGLIETKKLACEFYCLRAGKHFLVWSASGKPHHEFDALLPLIKLKVISEMRELWAARGDWFARVCISEVDRTLEEGDVKGWHTKARDAYLERLKSQSDSAAPAVATQVAIADASGDNTPAAVPDPAPAATSTSTNGTLESGSAALAKPSRQMAGELPNEAPESTSTVDAAKDPLTDPERMAERRRLRDEYGAAWKAVGRRVTDRSIGRKAFPRTESRRGWDSRYPVQKWLRLDPAYEGEPDRRIREILKERPDSAKNYKA
jgi:hypothetical protein